MLTRAILFLLLAGIARPEEWSGRVVAIQDGDTLTVLRGTAQVKVRLHGIDCPEKSQPYGNRAQQLAVSLALGLPVTVQARARDRFGRTLAVVILPKGRSLNDELLRAGAAWWYRQYAPRERRLQQLEESAREDRLGLWADPEPTPPWLWRKSRKQRAGATK